MLQSALILSCALGALLPHHPFADDGLSAGTSDASISSNSPPCGVATRGGPLDLTPALERFSMAGLARDVRLMSVGANDDVELLDELLLRAGVMTAGAGCCIMAPAAAPKSIGE